MITELRSSPFPIVLVPDRGDRSTRSPVRGADLRSGGDPCQVPVARGSGAAASAPYPENPARSSRLDRRSVRSPATVTPNVIGCIRKTRTSGARRPLCLARPSGGALRGCIAPCHAPTGASGRGSHASIRVALAPEHGDAQGSRHSVRRRRTPAQGATHHARQATDTGDLDSHWRWRGRGTGTCDGQPRTLAGHRRRHRSCPRCRTVRGGAKVADTAAPPGIRLWSSALDSDPACLTHRSANRATRPGGFPGSEGDVRRGDLGSGTSADLEVPVQGAAWVLGARIRPGAPTRFPASVAVRRQPSSRAGGQSPVSARLVPGPHRP